jgi:hypothetical protein
VPYSIDAQTWGKEGPEESEGGEAAKLSLSQTFPWIALATARFAGLPRAGLEGLRALRRAVDFPFRTVGRFFR